MSKTYLEIPFDDRLLTDLEEIAENEEGTDVQTLIPVLCAIYINTKKKEANNG